MRPEVPLRRDVDEQVARRGQLRVQLDLAEVLNAARVERDAKAAYRFRIVLFTPSAATSRS